MNRWRAGALLTAGLLLVVLLATAVAATGATDASPSPASATAAPAREDVQPTGGRVLQQGDLRSEGQGPGLRGDPLLVLAAVVALGAGTALLTVLLARMTERD